MQTTVTAPGQRDGTTGTSGIQFIAEALSLSPLGALVAVAAELKLGPDAVADLGPRLFGTPLQAALISVALVWMTIGVFVIRRGRSPLSQSVALMVFTIPATVAAVVGPWLDIVMG